MDTIDHAATGHIWHGITWVTGRPTLLLADLEHARLEQRDIVDHHVGLKVLSTTRCCTGRYTFRNTYEVEPAPCPDAAEAADGGQCAKCAAQDEFRFAHRYHQTGQGSTALRAYMDQPHWLYLATFGPGLTKVGTAAAPRKASRLNEQGPTWATYLAEAPDGRTVRHLEDGLSRALGLTQTVRASAKLAALTNPDPARAQQTHDALAVAAAIALAGRGLPPTTMDWTPPPESVAVRSADRGWQRVAYPHALEAGTHGFHVEACLGPVALVRLDQADDVRYLVDLNALKGARVALGPFTSPVTTTQAVLF